MSTEPALSASIEGSSSINHLILVCGHAIWLGGPSNGQNESEWYDNDNHSCLDISVLDLGVFKFPI